MRRLYPQAGFLNLGTIDLWGQRTLCRGNQPVRWQVLSSIPGLYTPGAYPPPTPSPCHDHQKCLQTLQNVPCRIKLPPVKNHCPGSSGSSAGEESTCNAGDPGSILESGRSPGEGIDYPLQYSWASLVAQLVKNPPAMQETWVGKIPWRRTWQPTPVFSPGESEWTEEPGGLQSMGSQRVGHN